MSDSDLMQLYSRRILALAADIPHLGRLDAPDATASVRSPQCGSTVTVDVGVTDARLTRLGMEVRACALGQASAAVLGAAAPGQSLDSIRKGRDQLQAMLTSGGPVPDAPFDGLEVLLPAREFANRHASILLAWNATVQAMDAA
ncbi:iron-sulfur cluster assembly scaffold protein [Paracoccus jiaweipingae]|uniref:iron-sulfur cluster assembly scaffold protein n=1 Tax=unclassified Paracoccus (in: a-proteobacteria) TaxID=2688777 RepID=UPI0037BA12C5